MEKYCKYSKKKTEAKQNAVGQTVPGKTGQQNTEFYPLFSAFSGWFGKFRFNWNTETGGLDTEAKRLKTKRFVSDSTDNCFGFSFDNFESN
jgi:hypothetical protein